MPANKEQGLVGEAKRPLSGTVSGSDVPFAALVPEESWLDPVPCSPETTNLGSASSRLLLAGVMSPCAEIVVISWSVGDTVAVSLGREEEELTGCRNDSPPAKGATSVSRSVGQRVGRDEPVLACARGLLWEG